MTRALVLGGGGPVGIAWETGLLAGLAEGGVDVASADWILGTSAGSFVGAHLAMTRDPAAMLHAELAAADRVRAASAPRAAPDLGPLMTLMMQRPPTGPMPRDLMLKFGEMSKTSQTVPEEVFLKGFGPLAEGEHPWPRGYACTAIDVETGELVVWGPDKAAPLLKAVASSCSVPGIFPPITIDGRLYMDGGMASINNAELARDHAKVLILAVVPPMMAPLMSPRLEPELDDIRQHGGEPLMLVPDAACGEVFGPNLMDASRRGDIARAGHAQGLKEATRVKAFWG